MLQNVLQFQEMHRKLKRSKATVKQLLGFVRHTVKDEHVPMSPEEVLVEQMEALRKAREANPELIMYTPRAFAYPSTVRTNL